MLKLDLTQFLMHHSDLDHVAYRFGAKPPRLSTPADSLLFLDCSAYVRIQIYHATRGGETFPDGSVNQRDECKKLGLYQLARYSDVQYAAHDSSRLFICFVAPMPRIAGHVWFVLAGKTYESRGGAGVSSRRWNLTFARLRKAVAFELPTEGGA
jgi:hypothetical protein